MKLNIEELSGFVALGCKSVHAVTRISNVFAQIEQVKLVIIQLQGNRHFFEVKMIEVWFCDLWSPL